MQRLLFVIIFLIYSLSSYCQIQISGIVLDIKSHKPIEFANVIVQDYTQTKILTFTLTNNFGEYSFELPKVVTDSIKVSFSALNIESQTLTVLSKSQRLDIKTKYKEFIIPEVVVSAHIPAVRKTGDTITYLTTKYIDANDVAIEDVIKKLPGVEVLASGKIMYQGKNISRFYVDGLDMLGGRYQVASKNIAAKDVRSVEIYENHQHIRALKEITNPDKAAMNITLKDEAKGTWTGSLLMAGGYNPWMRKAEVSAMFFGKKMQSINTYKTNNMGDNVAKEFVSLLGGSGEHNSSIIGIRRPVTPPLDQNLYLRNNVHALTSNYLFKISETTFLKLNASYTHDNQTSEGVSTTIHNIIGQEPIIINEVTYAAMQSDIVNLDIRIEKNEDKSYVNNCLQLNGDYNKDFGRINSNSTPVNQHFYLPSISARNQLNLIIPIKNAFSLNIVSDISYNNRPTSLRVYPMLCPGIFETSTDYSNAEQVLNSNKIEARNTLFASYSLNNWNFSLSVGLNAHSENMNSQLMPMNDNQQTIFSGDSLRNNISWQRYDFTFGPSVIYKLGNRFSASMRLFADFMSLKSEDKVRYASDNTNRIILNPTLNINGKISQDLKYSASASYTEYYGGLYDSYGGFIMTDYRNIATKGGELRHTKNQDYAFSIVYANALDLIFANFGASYWVADNNIIYAYDYSNNLTTISSFLKDNRAHGYRLNGKLSKQLLSISTVFSVGCGWNKSWSEIIRQGGMLNYMSDLFSISIGMNNRFTQWCLLDYVIDFSRSVNCIQGFDKGKSINYMKQSGELLFSFYKTLNVSLNAQHYYSGTLSPQYRNMVFCGVRIGFKAKSIHYTLEGRNLLNNNNYSSAMSSDITTYSYSYAINPRAIIASVRFNF